MNSKNGKNPNSERDNSVDPYHHRAYNTTTIPEDPTSAAAVTKDKNVLAMMNRTMINI